MDRTLRVFRWSAGETEGWRVYQVDAGVETTVLDAPVEIQRGQDATLAFRYACRVGMCGSCAMVVDGRERWACRTRLRDLPDGEVTVRPLYHFPLLRDLVVDMAPFDAKLRAVDAAFRPAPAAEPYAIISRDSAERREIDPAIECIGCGMCVSACTLVAHNPAFQARPRSTARSRSSAIVGTTAPRRAGRCCSPTTRWPAATARATAPRCVRRVWRPRRRSSVCAGWPRDDCSV